MSEIILDVQRLSFAWPGEAMTLSDIGFQVRKGTKVFLHGANGAGKTTLFQCLVGLLNPASGEIRIYSKAANKGKDRMNRIGIVFQNADDQIIAGSVFEEIAFGPLNMGLSRADVLQRVEQTIRMMNLEQLRDKPPHFLSHGEKKRVAMASVFSMQRDIVLLDEPTAGLDAFQVEELVGVLDRLVENGCTLLIATHDSDFSFRCADRAIIIDHGRIICEGSAEHVFSQDDVLEKAKMVRPQIMAFYELLHEKFDVGPNIPRNMRELSDLMRKARPR